MIALNTVFLTITYFDDKFIMMEECSGGAILAWPCTGSRNTSRLQKAASCRITRRMSLKSEF